MDEIDDTGLPHLENVVPGDEAGWEDISAALEESRIAQRNMAMGWEPSMGESSQVSTTLGWGPGVKEGSCACFD